VTALLIVALLVAGANLAGSIWEAHLAARPPLPSIGEEAARLLVRTGAVRRAP
jgi:hypothetical protein